MTTIAKTTFEMCFCNKFGDESDCALCQTDENAVYLTPVKTHLKKYNSAPSIKLAHRNSKQPSTDNYLRVFKMRKLCFSKDDNNK